MSESPLVLIFSVSSQLHGHRVASGALTAKEHAAKAVSQLEEANEVGTLVVFDFADVELATASYLKATVLWAVTCGRMHAGIIDAEELRSLDASQFQPLNIFPLVANTNAEIETELEEIFGGRWLACAIATQITAKKVVKAKVVGKLEPTAAKTLKAIKGLGEFTAYDLVERFPKEGINATAWNNRLVDLHRLRLLRRRKQGKFWKYQPVADQLIYG